MKHALVSTSSLLMALVSSTGLADPVEPKVADALQPVRLTQSELSGEIGRRIDDLIYRNYMGLDLDKDFLDAFRRRPYDGTKVRAYMGLGKVIDAGSMFVGTSVVNKTAVDQWNDYSVQIAAASNEATAATTTNAAQETAIAANEARINAVSNAPPSARRSLHRSIDRATSVR